MLKNINFKLILLCSFNYLFLGEFVNILQATPIDIENDIRNENILRWCSCHDASIEKRISLISFLVDSIVRNIPKDKDLIYLSYGSGELLQDYLTIKELIRNDYTKFTIILIDPVYSGPRGGIVNVFRDKAITALREKLNNPSSEFKMEVISFGDIKDYYTECKTNPKIKADIITMIDPEHSDSTIFSGETENIPDSISFSFFFFENGLSNDLKYGSRASVLKDDVFRLYKRKNANYLLNFSIVNTPGRISFFNSRKASIRPMSEPHLKKIYEIENFLKENINKILNEELEIHYQEKAKGIINFVNNQLLNQFNLTKKLYQSERESYPLYLTSLDEPRDERINPNHPSAHILLREPYINRARNIIAGIWHKPGSDYIFHIPEIIRFTGAKIIFFLTKNSILSSINPNEEQINQLYYELLRHCSN